MILVWIDGGDGPDGFKTEDLGGNLLIGTSLTDIGNKLGKNAEKVNWDGGSEINWDTFLSAIRNLRDKRSSSTKTCNVLLEGWNFIEDVARSLKRTNELGALESPIMQEIYQKIFYGNNLPAVTPSNKEYNPVWNKSEINVFSKAMKHAWKTFVLNEIFNIQPMALQ